MARTTGLVTVRNSGKEAQRFLFWICAHDKTLADMDFGDLIAYVAFLTNSQPAVERVYVVPPPPQRSALATVQRS